MYTFHTSFLFAAEGLRKQLKQGEMDDEFWPAVYDGDMRGLAQLAFPFICIELNICDAATDSNPHGISCEYFICGKGDYGWESYGYAEDFLGTGNGSADVDWTSLAWEEQLKQDMFDKLMQVCSTMQFSLINPNTNKLFPF